MRLFSLVVAIVIFLFGVAESAFANNKLNNLVQLAMGAKRFCLLINVANQKLYAYDPAGKLIKTYAISTSKKGIGQVFGSYKTPIGLHYVTEKIGANVPIYGIFKKRQFTGKVWHSKSNTRRSVPRKDHIVTRIFRLKGLENGINAGKNHLGQNVDSLARGIYIHGTTMEDHIGKPITIGCIHLTSADVIELFDYLPVGTLVLIQ